MSRSVQRHAVATATTAVATATTAITPAVAAATSIATHSLLLSLLSLPSALLLSSVSPKYFLCLITRLV